MLHILLRDYVNPAVKVTFLAVLLGAALGILTGIIDKVILDR